MSFLDHVDDLRKHLVKSALAILVLSIIAFFYIDNIFDDIILGPLHHDFFTYRKLCEWSHSYYHNDQLCVKDFQITLQNTEMAGQFMMSFKLAFLAGIILSMPYILYQVWKFIQPALNQKETKGSKGFVFYTGFLFGLGILFGYFVLCPISINFFATYTLSPLVKNEINIQSIVSFMSLLVLGTGLIFELPVLMYFLARIGIISSTFLKKYRKYAFVIILIVAAIVTPPDIVSQVILTIPLYMLFEIGVFITKRVENNKKKAEDDYQASLK
ncbi:MAG: twin-arginine translocase subunit TatC [Bacteroidetes bacterium]|nr:twin-arginine translocase subunit TatC [Bacteroidota bacterium]